MTASSRENHKRKSWTRLSFKHQRTRADQLAEDQALSHRVFRTSFTLLFAAGVTFLTGFGIVEDTWDQWAALAGMVLLVHTALFLLVRHYHREVLVSVRSFLEFFLLVGSFLVLSRALLVNDIVAFGIPLPLLAMSLALIYSSILAVHVSLGVACLIALMVWGEPSGAEQIPLVTSLFLGSLVAVLGVHRIRNRKRLFFVGAASGACQFATILIFDLWKGIPEIDPQNLGSLWVNFAYPGFGFLNGLVSGILLTSALPFLEDIFDVVTDMKLIELSDQNKPLLHQIALLAPGTWQHSLMVGQLAEEAAGSIGANDLLARVGALYHDIGKMGKPNYFVENIRGDENPHDRLSPEMSRLIIISHVKDGMAILKEERLPQLIIDMVPMHHGTTVVQYFFDKKKSQDGEHEKAQEQSFRYPGPRPTFPEAGILMLADSTEAIARTLKDPTPARLRTVVRRVIRDRMQDGQLDECDLTMSDLAKIEDAFVRVLAAIHHQRIRYQQNVEDEGEEDTDNGHGKENGNRSAKHARAHPNGNGADSTPAPTPRDVEKTR